MKEIKKYLLEDIENLTDDGICQVYKYMRRFVIADIEMENPLKVVETLEYQLKGFKDQYDKDNDKILELTTEAKFRETAIEYQNKSMETMQKRIDELENKEVKGFVVFAETGFTFKQISIPFNTEEDCESFIETMEGTMAYKDTKMMYCNVKMIGWQPI